MKQIPQLQEDFLELDKSDDLRVIEFYESHSETFNSLNPCENVNHYNFKMHVLSYYGISLLSAGYFTKSESILKDAIAMFEHSPELDSSELHKIRFFEKTFWSYALALWEVGDIKKAIQAFNNLVENHPDNDKYKAWLKALKAARLRKLIQPLWVICGLFLFGHLVFFRNFHDQVQIILAFLGLFLLSVVSISVLYLYLLTKRKLKCKG